MSLLDALRIATLMNMMHWFTGSQAAPQAEVPEPAEHAVIWISENHNTSIF